MPGLVERSALLRREQDVHTGHAGQPADWMVVGGDLGGTSTRVLVAGKDGLPLGRGTAGGGNPVSHPGTAAAALGQAMAHALAGLEPALVRAAVIGVAGGSALSRPEVRDAFDRVWADLGMGCLPRYASDLEIAFAAGTSEPDGTILIAGTGAVAGAVRNRQLIQTVDGHGWLLGDDGSGFWLGREAARATLRTLDAGEEPGPLVRSVLRELAALDEPTALSQRPDLSWQRVRVIDTVNSRPAVRLAELAPLVTAACAENDHVAKRIVEQAARLLLETVCRVRRPEERTPIVLAGGLTDKESPVGARLRDLVDQRLSGPVRSVLDGVGGAAWLALSEVDPAAATVQARLRLALT
ncbi:MAG: ATPase [Actinomycetota bacterium]|nr:ATPase [Actinomycetota bacterium]